MNSEIVGKIIGVLIIGGVGILITVFGWLMHDYHVNKVSAENKQAFCKLSGIGLVVIGVGLLISGIILGLTDSPFSFLCFAACFIAGLVMLITAGRKYNR